MTIIESAVLETGIVEFTPLVGIEELKAIIRAKIGGRLWGKALVGELCDVAYRALLPSRQDLLEFVREIALGIPSPKAEELDQLANVVAEKVKGHLSLDEITRTLRETFTRRAITGPTEEPAGAEPEGDR
jgi:hypothetical protein